jgi:imidazolonepropionase-like amidohydrolase
MSEKYMVIKGGRLIDGTGSDPIDNAIILIKNDRIEAVGSEGAEGAVDYPKEAEVVDATGKTVMPGLIDAHIHFAGLRSMNQLTWFFDDPTLRAMRCVADAWKLVDAGFTTVRDIGSVYGIRIRDAVNEGSCVGPRIVASGRAISQTGGHSDVLHSLPVEANERLGIGRIADGVAEVRKAAREQLRDGADFLKIMTTGGVMSERDVSTSCQFSLEEIRAVVEEAANVGCRTASHAQGTNGVKNALIGGIKVIEHGMYLDQECLDLMVKNNHYLVPTLAIVDTIVVNGEKVGVLPSSIHKAKIAQEAHIESFKKAYKAGILCGLGTDYLSDPMSPFGQNAIELEIYVNKVGLSSMETIVCATKNNAEVLDLADKIGTLETGKQADLIIIDGDPLADISVLRGREKILRIFKGGQEVPRLNARNLRGSN